MSAGPTTLQQICSAATATWLTEWSALVGQVSARAATMQLGNTRPRHSAHPTKEPHKTSSECATNSVAICFTECNSVLSTPQKFFGTPNEIKIYDTVNKKRGRSCRCKKRNEKNNNLISVQYDDATKFHDKCGETSIYNSASKHYERWRDPNIFSLQNKVRDNFNREIITMNTDECSGFLRHYLPPVLIDQIVSLSWKHISRLVIHRSHNIQSADYEVADWIRRASILITLASKVTERKFPLDISGIPDNLIEHVLNIVYNLFPLKTLSSLVIPKDDFKKSPVEISGPCRESYRNIVLGTYLTSVILNSRICDDSMLHTFSQLSLKELSVNSNLITEKGIVNGLFALELHTIAEVIDIIAKEHLKSYPESPLRKSLQSLDVISQNLSKLVYYIIPIIFSKLQHYNPHRNLIQCMQNCERLARVSNSDSHIFQNTYNLLKMNMGCPNRVLLTEAARICPLLQEVSLIVDLNAEQILPALEVHTHVTTLDITYFPSFSSSPPKLDASILLSVFTKFSSQLKSLSLTGFNVIGNVLYEISLLPELQQLSFTDCWLSNPRLQPIKPFPSLQKLSMKFLPANSTMQLLTMGANLQSLHLDLTESEWEGNALTDDYIKYLVSSGIVRSLHTFTASSSNLTIKSLKTLASLPFLKVVGYLASWGLTDEELRCIDHSGPQHLLYYM